jgi:hypothetical protein
MGYASTATFGKSSALSLAADSYISSAKNNVLSKCHIGFLPNYRTTDHVFTLHIDKQANHNKGKVFSCFVDFKNDFDSIWHEGLQYKFKESGVVGKTYDRKSMYTNNKCVVKIGKKHPHFFPEGRG